MDNRFLVDWNILSLNFHAQIPARYHHAVSDFQDGFQVVKAFLVFNLSDNLNRRLAHFNQNFPNRQNVFSPSDKRSGDEVNILFTAKTDIRIILFRDKRHGQLDIRHIAAFAGLDHTGIFNAAG